MGYGDVTPAGDMERMYAIFAMLIGVSFYSYIIASVSSMVSSIDSKNAIEIERMDQLAAWMDHYEIQPALQRRVRRFFKQFYCEHSAIDDEYIMEKLAPNLQEAISRYLLHDFILEHKLFAELPEGALWKVMLIVRSMKYEPNSTVVQRNEANVALFILKEGEASIMGECFQQGADDVALVEGDSFGELCLLGILNNSDVTVTATSKATFFYIRRDALIEAFHNLPEILEHMVRIRNMYNDAAVHSRGSEGSTPRLSTTRTSSNHARRPSKKELIPIPAASRPQTRSSKPRSEPPRTPSSLPLPPMGCDRGVTADAAPRNTHESQSPAIPPIRPRPRGLAIASRQNAIWHPSIALRKPPPLKLRH